MALTGEWPRLSSHEGQNMRDKSSSYFWDFIISASNNKTHLQALYEEL